MTSMIDNCSFSRGSLLDLLEVIRMRLMQHSEIGLGLLRLKRICGVQLWWKMNCLTMKIKEWDEEWSKG